MMHFLSRLSWWRCVVLCAAVTAPSRAADDPVACWKGTDFQGGCADMRNEWFDMEGVNYAYARPTGERSRMTVQFNLESKPADPVFLHLQARDDDGPGICPIAILLNRKAIFEGPNGFAADKWEARRFALPVDALQVGRNELVIANTAAEGTLGEPPWFMVARAALGAQRVDVAACSATRDFFVTLPAKMRPVPEPALPGQKVPGFAIRGIKGWKWTPEQYLAEIPVLARYKMNFLMNCYLSMFDIENIQGGGNQWWLPLPGQKKSKYEEVVRSCKEHGVEFCFAMNPNLSSSRILDYDSPKDLEDLWQHYAWMADLGVNWFSICLDDIKAGIEPKGQSRLVNEIFRRLREKNPKARMIFCPTVYLGRAVKEDDRRYLSVLATDLHPEVYCFWTGDQCVGEITRDAAESFAKAIGHRLFIWDNYPVNDEAPTLHLGPVTERDPDLCEVIDGYMANPLCPQNEINRIPLITEADYAYNPYGYDPARSIGQAILHLADTPQRRAVLKELVEMYPGMLIEDTHRTDWNPVLDRFRKILDRPNSRWQAEAFARHIEGFCARFAQAFPDQFEDGQDMVRQNLSRMQSLLRGKYPE
ncbi:MAG TPA: beta-N-acetylglucosaminidase domain-containing protein [Phycisphaerae bacterium]|nr:beta-N-acetylglucosaminidase domain-containing protein [Phycisphaerae bacterium]